MPKNGERKRRCLPLAAPLTNGRHHLAAMPADGVVADNMLLLAMQLCGTARPSDPRVLLQLLGLSSRFSHALIEAFGCLRSVWVHYELPGKFAPDERLSLEYLRIMVRHKYDVTWTRQAGYLHMGPTGFSSVATLYANLWRIDKGAVDEVNRRVALAREAKAFLTEHMPDIRVDALVDRARALYKSGLVTPRHVDPVWAQAHQAFFAYCMLKIKLPPDQQPTVAAVRQFRMPVRLGEYQGLRGLYANWTKKQSHGVRSVPTKLIAGPRRRAVQCCICLLPIARTEPLFRSTACSAHVNCFEQFFIRKA
mgnify:CR=1 FL=1